MFYFLALNSDSVFAGNDISVYPVTGIGFVFRVNSSKINAYRSMPGTSDNLLDSYLQEHERFFVCSPQRVCWSPILD